MDEYYDPLCDPPDEPNYPDDSEEFYEWLKTEEGKKAIEKELKENPDATEDNVEEWVWQGKAWQEEWERRREEEYYDYDPY